ncbi:MAG: ATP-binding protein [Anaerolineaceae bacterium]|nr:ATP-binding protein [Anaerolineaceae bacterium]
MKAKLPVQQWLIEPSRAVRQPDECRQVRMLATIQLALTGVFLLGVVILRISTHFVSSILTVNVLFNAAAYVLSRTRYYRLSAFLSVVFNNVTPLYLAFFSGRFSPLEFNMMIVATILSLFLSKMFFPFRFLVAHTVLNFLVIFGLAGWMRIDLLRALSPLLLLAGISAMILVAARFRDQLEEYRLQTLSAAVGELEMIRAELEQRVIGRTQELEQAYDTIQAEHEHLLQSEKLASLGRLTGGVAHEINTPLAASRAALMQVHKLVDEYRDSLGDPQVTQEDYAEIGEEMLQSLSLADHSLDQIAGFVRSIKGQIRDVVPRERILFNAVPVIRDSILLVNHTLRAGNCRVVFTPAADTVEVRGLPGQLAQIVINLMTNAIDASVAKGGGTIHIDLTPHADEVLLVVSDQGAGIAPDVLPRIFDLLFTTKPSGYGTGLGLPIVRDILGDVFKGSIDVASQLGQGTTFTLHFPTSGEN